jgi:hypothetical protein
MPDEECGVVWYGQPEAITRLVLGFGTDITTALEKGLGVPAAQVEQAVQQIREHTEVTLWHPAMPVQDAIDVAEFLVDLTVHFHRFLPGAPIVGGPIEIAAITKHEGFKWIRRKYYYDREINPEVSN